MSSSKQPEWVTLPLPLDGEGQPAEPPHAEEWAAAKIEEWAAAKIAMIGVRERAEAMMRRRAERAAARAEGKRRKGQGGK